MLGVAQVLSHASGIVARIQHGFEANVSLDSDRDETNRKQRDWANRERLVRTKRMVVLKERDIPALQEIEHGRRLPIGTGLDDRKAQALDHLFRLVEVDI